jgi:preprotein translocase subunit SecA
MDTGKWKQRLEKWRGAASPEVDLAPYRLVLEKTNREGKGLTGKSDEDLREIAARLRTRARGAEPTEDLLVKTFALVREVADRTVGMRPFDVQMLAAAALHHGKLVEMNTGEGKTLAAVPAACLNGLAGHGVHVLTFNDYLARRDAAWMGPVYRFLGLSVGVVQEGMDVGARQAAYGADITYATAKEAGFDFLRMHLARHPCRLVHRPFNYAIVDEADSILIDEARVPLVIAGDRPSSKTSPYRIAEVVAGLKEGEAWETDTNRRNVFLSDRGFDRMEEVLGCGDLHGDENYILLTEINQALHARVLLKRDVDYIVRDDRIELVDEFTGRVVDDRRWPDGLQAALEAKEGLPIQPGGRILGSITLQHFLRRYPKLSGMTATARPAAGELEHLYDLKIVVIPPNQPCVREDLPDVIFTHGAAKIRNLVSEIARIHRTGRPILVGTRSVEESEVLAGELETAGIGCRVLNAKNDQAEAAIVTQAGAPGAVTISTNMAGRGTDIRLGGADERDRERVVALGGLYVIGTNRHESRRIDDQLRGRAGRQGDPGCSCFFVSLEDDLMVRFGIDRLIPPALRPARQAEPVSHAVIRREVDRLQRIVEGQNHDIRETLWRYSSLLERQRITLHEWRMGVLTGEEELDLAAGRVPERYAGLSERFGKEAVRAAEQAVTLHWIDRCWADHLAAVAEVREGIHLADVGGLDPLREYQKQIAEAFRGLHPTIEDRILETFKTLEITEKGIDLGRSGIHGPSSTWTYLVNDRVLSDLQRMLSGSGSSATGAAGVLMTWPILVAWWIWEWLKRRKA